MKTRYDELDSIRGIAAMIVLIGHFSVIYPIYTHAFLHSTTGTTLSFLWNGHGSVIIFFVLSGFVLSLPFQQTFDQVLVKNYLIKRIFRIYIPYIVVISFALVSQLGIQNFNIHSPVTKMVQWAQWKQTLSLHTILSHYLFLGEFNFSAIDMVIWSLVHEMRISLVFPIVLFFLFRMKWPIQIGIGVLFSLLSFILIKTIPTGYNDPLSTNYFITLHYLFMFIAGALLARYKDYLIRWMSALKLSFLLFLLALFMFNFPSLILSVGVKLLGNPDYILYTIFSDWLIMCSACYIILFALSSKILSSILLFRPINFLGKISYSLYLIHPVVLIVLAHVIKVSGRLSLLGLWLVALITTLLLATLSYKFIEKPSIKWGRAFSNRVFSINKNETVVYPHKNPIG